MIKSINPSINSGIESLIVLPLKGYVIWGEFLNFFITQFLHLLNGGRVTNCNAQNKQMLNEILILTSRVQVSQLAQW